MNKVLVIAYREFFETVKTKAFLFGALFMPGLITLIILGSQKMEKLAEKEVVAVKRIAVADGHGRVYGELMQQMADYNKENPQRRVELEKAATPDGPREALNERVIRGELYGYIVVPREAVDGDAACTLARKDSQLSAGKMLNDRLTKAIVAVRFTDNDAATQAKLAECMASLKRIQRPPNIEEVDPGSGKQMESNSMARIMTPFIFAFLLYMGTFGISMGLLTSLLEEKSTRAIEVLLAAVSPMQLMSGKILGSAAVGLLTLAIWGIVGVGAGRGTQFGESIKVTQLIYFGLYFVPAFLLMSGLLAAIGSACNTLKEAQSMSSPLTIINIVPIMLWFMISQHPNSLFAVVLSFIPPITPIVMMMRICADANTPVWQIVASMVLLWASVIVIFWAAARVFRIGILMYGKPPSLKELFRWTQYA